MDFNWAEQKHIVLFELVSQPQDCTARTVNLFNLLTSLSESGHLVSFDVSVPQAPYLSFGLGNTLNRSPETELQPILAFCFLTP